MRVMSDMVIDPISLNINCTSLLKYLISSMLMRWI